MAGPDRIWTASTDGTCHVGFDTPSLNYTNEYIRADLAFPMWPDFIAPPKYDNPDPRWQDPALPDFRLIWKVARECGYSVGLHGSMKRDCDMIAAPWTDEAVIAFELIDRLCAALNAKVVGPVAGKPHGRLGWNLQIDGYVKVIDISVLPRLVDLGISSAPLINMRAEAQGLVDAAEVVLQNAAFSTGCNCSKCVRQSTALRAAAARTTAALHGDG